MGKAITLCRPNGFCAGVERAIKIVDLAIEAVFEDLDLKHKVVKEVIIRLFDNLLKQQHPP